MSSQAIGVTFFDELETKIFAHVCHKHYGNFKASPAWNRYIKFLYAIEQRGCEEDFALFRILGRGGFGMVYGCKRAYTGKLYAMKIMDLKRVKNKKAESLCLNERNVLAAVDSPFLVCLKAAFITSSELYLILDLMIGGDLGYHLSRKGRFTPAETKYYSARIVAGIAALHDLSIVYRDLKPENILMDENGRTKVSDLGLACKVGRSGISGTCGTRGYWAPEMLRRDSNGRRERYNVSVDWFSLGCVMYEFLSGVCPFRSDRAKQWGPFPKLGTSNTRDIWLCH
jgi:beta-adrenergic-receptor kinase